MKTRSVGTNAVLNVFRTLLTLIVPLITYPYVSRILGAENLGKVNYVNSIISYFILVSGLGISTYGVREGAKIRDNKQKVSAFISECFSIAAIMTVISYLLLSFFVFAFSSLSHYKYLFFIECLLIAFDTIGIEWVNTIFEDYLYITIRTIVVYLVSIIAIFALIHNRNDYFIYAAITVGTTGLVSVLNWLHCRKHCDIKLTVNDHTKRHIKPILVFFANKLAVSLYVNSDITMIGYMVGDVRVGIYSVAVKVYTIVKNLLSAIYTVTISRLSSKIGKNDEVGFRDLFSKLTSFVTLAIFPAMIGLCLLAPNIILLLFGNEYSEAGKSLRILSIGIVFAIYGGIVSTVYNVTRGLEKYSLQATIIAAIVNVTLNLVLVPVLNEIGAAITTVIAELFTFVYCFLRANGIKESVDWKDFIRNFVHALLGCIEIVFVVIITEKMIKNNLLFICLSIIISVLFYSLTLFILKNYFICIFINKLKRRD